MQPLVTQRQQCFKSGLCCALQIVGIGLEGTAQGAVAVAALAFKVGNGVHAGRHGLVAAHPLVVHTAQEQTHLGEPVNQPVQGHTVECCRLVIGQRCLQLCVGVTGVRVGQQPAQHPAGDLRAPQSVGRQ